MIKNRFSKKEIGNLGEEIASRWLSKNGYRILRKNFHSRVGEIDIIAKDKDCICFIEVKTRRENHYGRPFEAVTEYKQKRLRKSALYFLKIEGLNPDKCSLRFDVVSIDFRDGKPRIELLKNAF